MESSKKIVRIGNIELSDFPLLLAPMEDVSDPPFRVLCKEQGADLVYSEFISSEGLIRNAEKSLKKLDFFPSERPVGIQIFGGDEHSLVMAAEKIAETKPDLIDINFGCPVKKVVNKGGGAALLKDLKRMVHFAAQVVKSSKLPVTVKTRLGWDAENIYIVDLAEALQDVGVKALTIHARTRVQMYKGEANWTWYQKIRNNPRFKIPLFGNGDIKSPQQALEYRKKYPVDGMMIGRASIGNVWIFRDIKSFFNTGHLPQPPSFDERKKMCLRHLLLSIEWKGEKTAINEMRRHYASYFKNQNHAKEIRVKLNTANNIEEIYEILNNVEHNCYL